MSLIKLQSERNPKLEPSWVLLLGLVVLSLFLANAQMSLWDQDEAAYAGFGMRMLRSGDWLVPDFIWSDVHRKVPFHFWAIATSFGAFGIHAWALRLPAILAVLGTLAWIRWGMKPLLSR
ncbi:MAG: hypothetical protein AAF804_12220, partial [Bacteroidota bacterium]